MKNEKLTFTAPSWDYIEELTVKLFKKIISDNYFEPHVIAGISRGGLVPARIISDLFLSYNKKITLSVMQIGLYSGVGKTQKEPIIYQDLPGHVHGKKILLVDDVADSGVSLKFAMQYLNMKKPEEVKIATLYFKPWSVIKPHYFVEETTAWIVFPHERYEFMREQYFTKELNKNKALEYFISEVGLPEYSVKLFLELQR